MFEEIPPRIELNEWTEETRVLQDKVRYTGLKDIFTEMMIETVPKNYVPNNRVLALCVGGDGCIDEGIMLKEFYKKRFQLEPENVLVASADTHPYIENNIMPEYDFKVNGPAGDARIDFPYWQVLSEFNNKFKENRLTINHIHYNSPNSSLWEDLTAMISKSGEYLAEGGILSLVTNDFVLREDLPSLNYLRNCIAENSSYQVTPFYRFKVKDSNLSTFGTFTALKKVINNKQQNN